MKSLILSFILIFFLASAYAQLPGFTYIICGTQPKEVHLTCFHGLYLGLSGFYHSSDDGEYIELRDSSEFGFGALLKDAADNTLYRFGPYSQYCSTNGGFSWTLIDTVQTSYFYTSGVIPGEIYRRLNTTQLERSLNYGVSYTPCSCNGGPDSLGISAAALGSDSGEVYVLGDHGKLYYSQDYAENFTYLSDLYHLYGISPGSSLINGQLPGEVFTFDNAGRIHRVYNYGANEELLTDFDYLFMFWGCSATASHTPGELYYMATHPDMVPGGEMHIYHTLDYFQTYTRYVHIITSEGVIEPQTCITPNTINISVWPNPTNAAFTISYQLNNLQSTNLIMYNILGQAVWAYQAGLQPPGNYQVPFTNNGLSSGKYFLSFPHHGSNIITPIIIIK
jgi:hypothetical protein